MATMMTTKMIQSIELQSLKTKYADNLWFPKLCISVVRVNFSEF